MANRKITSNSASRQGWFYRAYTKFGCLFAFLIIGATMIASMWVCVTIFDLGMEPSCLITFAMMVIIGFVLHLYTSEACGGRGKGKRRKPKSINPHSEDDEPVLDDGDLLCWKCGSNMILRYEDGTCMCQSCGFIFSE